jgi:hypothetical protein
MLHISNDDDLRALLGTYEVPGPSTELVRRTTALMHAALIPAPAMATLPAVHVTAMVALALVMSLGLCYVLTVGTLLSFVLPAQYLLLVRHSFIAAGGAGGCIIAGTLMVLSFRQWCDYHPVTSGNMVGTGCQ